MLQGDDAILSHLEQSPEVFLPTIVVGELFFGAAKSGRPTENIRTVEQFVVGRSVVPCDFAVAREYGLLKRRLQEKGRPLPENDIWIAATALRHQMTLITRDAHFREVDGLAVEEWAVKP